MSKYVEAEKFAYRYKCLEQVARNHLMSCDISDDVDYHTQIQERADVQKDLRVFPGIEIVRCQYCVLRATDECPMYHVEWISYDDDGYTEMVDKVYDWTEDDGFCHLGKEKVNHDD